MISANELRIGNWVKCIKDDFDLFIRVSGISVRSDKHQTDEQFYGVYEYYLELNDFDFLNSGKNFEAFVNYHRGVKSPENIEGIQLTEEILLKCGFENIGSVYNTWGLKSNEFSGYLFTIELDKPFYFKVCDLLLNHWSERPIQYVHQLQNLYFALTGEELTINL